MPKARDLQHGSFVERLIEFYDHPTFDSLMEAYLKADRKNREAIEKACRSINIGRIWDDERGDYSDQFLEFKQVHNMWLQMHHAGNLRAPLAKRFELLARLDEEMDDPRSIPLRRDEPE